MEVHFRHTRRGHRIPITDGYKPPCGCWDLNPGPLEELSVLLTTKPSLQALNLFYVYEYTVPVFRHTRRGHQIPITDGYEPLCGCWELNLEPLGDQSGLLTSEPSLQHPSPSPSFPPPLLLALILFSFFRHSLIVSQVGLKLSMQVESGLEPLTFLALPQEC